MHDHLRLDPQHLDLLKEIGNIGAAHAATALSNLLDKRVDMLVPDVRFIPFEEISDRVGGAEQLVIAVLLQIHGEVSGHLLFVISTEAARRLLHHLDVPATGERVQDIQLTELEASALSEIGNIMAGSYLSSLADFTRLHMYPSVPSIAMDMAGAILSYSLLEYGHVADYALLIDTTFTEGLEEVESHFFLLPNPDSLAPIFHSLGVTGI